jgi:hypothetical protein
MHTYTKLFSLLIIAAVVAMPILVADANPTVSLSLYKDNGYGLGNDIAGLWTLKTSVSADTAYVEFYLGDQLQQNTTASPFSWQFDTANYPIGEHTLRAVAYDSAGISATDQVTRNFVENNTSGIVTLVIAVTVAIVVVAVAIAVYRIKKTKK